MKLSGTSPITWSLLPLLAIAAVLAFLLATPDSSVQASNNYDIILPIRYCNALPNSAPFNQFGVVGDPACTNPVPTPGDPMTTTVLLDIPTGELNFSILATFTPPAATVTPSTSIPVGDIVGGLNSAATLGIGNGACSTSIPVPFILYNVAMPDAAPGTVVVAGQADLGATIDTSDTGYIDDDSSTTITVGDTRGILGNPRASSNIYVPLPEGTSSGDINVADTDETPTGITSSSVAVSTEITTSLAHGLQDGDEVEIVGHIGSTPAINGTRIVTRTGTTTFTIPVDVTVDGTGGTVTRTVLAEITRGRFQNGVPDTLPVFFDNGVPDIGPSTSLAIQEFPDYLLDLFDPDWVPVDPALNGPFNSGAGNDVTDTLQNPSDGPLPPVLPLAVYGSLTAPEPASEDWIPLYFLVYDKGALPIGGFTAPHPLSNLGPDLGYANMTVLTDTSEVAADISLITDFCSSLLTDTILLGNTVDPITLNPTATVRVSIPPANSGRLGTHLGLTFSTSLRDLDNDGWENAYDTCPKVANVDDPGIFAGDDLDMIDPACDPDPNLNEAGGPIQCPGQFLAQTQPGDIDGDCFSNAQDNCPQVANGRTQENGAWNNQRDGEAFGTYATAASDGGPKTDSIGDSCDNGSATFIQNGVSTTVNLTTTVADGHYHSVGFASAVCVAVAQGDGDTNGFDDADNDGDGWCAATESAEGGDDSDPNVTPPLGLSPPDVDGDGFSVWIETFIGTDDIHGASVTSTANDEPLDYWPPDFDDNQAVNSDDEDTVMDSLDSRRGEDAYDRRFDLDASTKITMEDFGIIHSMVGLANGSPPPAPLGGGDDDGDGVADGSDLCPGTRSGENPIDADGCTSLQADYDGDGDKNNTFGTDNCPGTPNAAQENAVHPATIRGDHCEDPDGDSIMDIIDVCPDDPNDDADGDGICVGAAFQAPKTAGNDNCPNTANAGQENDVHTGTPEGDHCEDPDSDTVMDNIDNCPDTANAGQEDTVHPGNGGDHCEDPDADNVMDITDNCPDAANPGQEDVVHPGNGGDACENPDGDPYVDAVDNCPDTFTVWIVPLADSDCDGHNDADEIFIGTLPNVACGAGAWAVDINDTQGVDIFDVLELAPPVFFSVAPGPPYQARFDLNPSGGIDIFDVLRMAPPMFFATCP